MLELSVPFNRITSPRSPKRASVSDLSGNVIVRSAVGSVTVKVVSKAFAVAPSKMIDESKDNPEISDLKLLNC